LDAKASNKERELKLLLVAGRNHLTRKDVMSVLDLLKSEEFGFDISLKLSDPSKEPELLELHRLVAIPALIKIHPSPKQIFAGNRIFEQLKHWLPRWEQETLINELELRVSSTETEGTNTPKELILEDELLFLRQENETLSGRIESQERLLRMVAHELRTPLSAAVLAIQSEVLGQIDQKKCQEVVKRRLEEIELLSKDLLEVGTTRWEALFNPQKINLANISAEVILSLEKNWLKRKIIVDTDIPLDLPTVLADQRRMRQVLLNLIENAIKFSKDGENIQITMMHKTNQWVQVSVSDKGPGIPEEEQQRIFLDRVRLPQTSNETSGFGIGLSVCRRIVEVHGGKIWVTSEPGQGACFHFTVPVSNKSSKSW
tara:strand:- start:771 stop:1886 length:1116 start_codon:yes stop_codon:yes gene_type:complete